MLKIRQPRNAYDLLGLPRGATGVQIRARYRQLIRRHRKELSTSDLMQNDRFRQWTNAYLLLMSPDRIEYTRRLRESRGREQPDDRLGKLPKAQAMLIQAEAAYVRRKLNEAAEIAREALKHDKRSAAGCALLGDILSDQGKYSNALTMYNYAIQFDPNNRRYWQLLQEVTALRDGKASPRRYRSEIVTPLNRPASAWVGIGLAVVFVELSMFYMQARWGSPGPFGIPMNLLYWAVVDGLLMGLVLAATGVLGKFEDELLWYQVSGIGAEMVPVGVFVALPGVVFFWAAPTFYLFVSYLDENISLSITIALVLCSAMTVAFGQVAPEASGKAVYWLGGNFVFLGFLCGWMLGSIRMRRFER